MTVASALNRKTFTGDAVTTSFGTSPVVFFDTSDLLVYAVVTATGVATLLTENTDYTVTGGNGSTGTVSTAGGSSPYGAPAATVTLVIVREVPLTQEADFENNDASDADVLEEVVDRLTMQSQQLSARLDRTVLLPDTDVSGASTELPVPVASTLLGWDDAGTALQNYAMGEVDVAIPVSAFMQTVLDDASAGAALTTLGVSAFIKTLLDDADAATALATLGVPVRRILRQTVSVAQASVAFTNLSGYAAVLFLFEQVLPVTNSVNLLMRVSVDNGANYISTANYDSAIKVVTAGGTEGVVGVSGGTAIRLNGSNLYNNASLGVNGQALVNGLDNSAYKYFTIDTSYSSSVPLNERAAIAGVYGGAVTAINAIQFLMSSGNIAAGSSITAFGFKGS